MRGLAYLHVSNRCPFSNKGGGSQAAAGSSVLLAVLQARIIKIIITKFQASRDRKKSKERDEGTSPSHSVTRAPRRRRDEALRDALIEIFTLTTTTLRTITIDCEYRLRTAQLAAIASLSGLTSLTVTEYLALSLFHRETNRSLFQSPEAIRLPSLRYLDLAGLRKRIRVHPFNLYESITELAPCLTHLRLPLEMANGLEHALGWSEGGDPAHKLPLTIERVYVQLSPPASASGPPPEFACFGSVNTVSMEESRFKALASMYDKVVVLEPEFGDSRIEDIEDII